MLDGLKCVRIKPFSPAFELKWPEVSCQTAGLTSDTSSGSVPVQQTLSESQRAARGVTAKRTRVLTHTSRLKQMEISILRTNERMNARVISSRSNTAVQVGIKKEPSWIRVQSTYLHIVRLELIFSVQAFHEAGGPYHLNKTRTSGHMTSHRTPSILQASYI